MKPKVKKGQIWERKKDGYRIFIHKGKGDEWKSQCLNNKKSHHIITFDLHKYWKLIETEQKMRHFIYVPFTGLGLYGGHRGSRWLKNRIKIFKQFVVPSLLAQTNQNFTIWISWRPEDRGNLAITELYLDLVRMFGEERVAFSYSGVCFWDDKYEDALAHDRLATALHGSFRDIINYVGDVKHVLMTIQPSDDCYHKDMVQEMQNVFKETDLQAVGFKHGYIMNYQTKELREYNPKTNPPFFTIKFPRETFLDPLAHMKYTGPYKSHEYIGEKLNYKQFDARGFLVGTHGENISTHFKHPYAGELIPITELNNFGILNVPNLKINYSIRKQILRKLPHRVQRKLRYIFGEKIYQTIYNYLRS